jgi:hypothetical protein
MRTATNERSIKTITKEELVSVVDIKGSIIELAKLWESNRATKVIQMVAKAFDVSQSEVSKALNELLAVGTLVLDGTKLRADMHRCDGCDRMVARDNISLASLTSSSSHVLTATKVNYRRRKLYVVSGAKKTMRKTKCMELHS